MRQDAYTRLERAALDGLAWELSHQAPDLAGQIAESLPGQRRVQGPVFLTEAIVDRRRPNPPESTTGRLGTIHVLIDDLDHAIAFQAELLNGRLIALHGDAYGQDLSAVTLTGDVVDQVFMVMADGRSIPFDRPTETEILETSPLRRMQENPDPPDPFVAPAPHAATRPRPSAAPPLDALFGPRRWDAAPRNATDSALELLFGRRTGPPAPAAQPGDPAADDLMSVRIGIVALAAVVALVASLFMDFHIVFAAVPAAWIARALLRKPVVERIARTLRARRT